ncbi:MAG: CocE/NonD family hydrolase [Aestuariivita sp.]|nr:CocE/NonD family hydrolase [Aestuariivita sp.]
MTIAPCEIEELPNIGIILKDGTRLSARIWRPINASENPVPAILEYLPYRKRDGTCARDMLTHPYFAQHGYACVRVDIRGNGDSDRLMNDEYTQQELDDAIDVIEWLSQQPWCTGKVGMMGISWGGFNALQTAALNPKPLKAIITLCSTVDRFADDIHYKGGCLLNENLGWGATMWSYSSRPPDPKLRPNYWRQIWRKRLEHEPFLPSIWLRHQKRDYYWKHGSVCENYAAIKAKVLAIGGWGDAYKNAIPQLVQNLDGAKGIIGPWVHKYPHFAAPEPRINFIEEALRWWDRWLKGINTNVEDDPSYSVYLMSASRPSSWYNERPGYWINATLQSDDIKILYLSPTGLQDIAKPFQTTFSSPQTTGATGGEYCAIWLGPEMPGDQRTDDALSLCFDSAPLQADMTIVGAPTLKLCLRSNKPSGLLAVRFNHIHPDNASYRITYGVLNLAHRNGSEQPTPVPVNEEFDIDLQLDCIAYTIPKGHKIRIAISTSYWPLVWPMPVIAELTLSAGQLALPVRSHCEQDDRIFSKPGKISPWKPEIIRMQNHIRKTEIDHSTGESTLSIIDDFGKVRDPDHGLIYGSIGRELWSILPDDPLSAKGTCHWSSETKRDDLTLKTETYCQMWSDATFFYLNAQLQAYETSTLLFEKSVEDRIPRENL